MSEKLIDIDESAKDFHHTYLLGKTTKDEGVFETREEASEGNDSAYCYIMKVDSDDFWFVLCSQSKGLRPGMFGKDDLDKWFKGITIKGRILQEKAEK